MALSDKKKVQTMVNVAGQQIEIIRAAVATFGTVRDAFIAENPDVAGTPLEGKKANLNTRFNTLKAESDQQIWTDLIADIVPSHRNVALD